MRFSSKPLFRYLNEVFGKIEEIHDDGILFVNMHIAPKCESLWTSNRSFLFELRNISFVFPLLNCIPCISFYACVGFNSYNFVFKIQKRDCFKCKSWQAAHLKCFCGNSLLQIQNQQAALWNYLVPCKWTSAIVTLPPTRFGENHWRAVSSSPVEIAFTRKKFIKSWNLARWLRAMPWPTKKKHVLDMGLPLFRPLKSAI